MQSAISSSPTAEIMTSGTFLAECKYVFKYYSRISWSYLKMNWKFETMSSRTYSGRFLKASGCFSGSGSLTQISTTLIVVHVVCLLDCFFRGIICLRSNSKQPNCNVSHE